MSYYVTCYYADTTIKKTYIYSGTTLKKTLIHSGETDDNGDDISFVNEYSENLRFQATPADGYVTTWAYRVDSNKDVLEHHYVDTFPYTNQEGLSIRAEGKKPSSISSLSVSQTQSGVKKARVQFNTSGMMGGKFYIYANKYEKLRGIVTDYVENSGVIIEFDNFDIYTIEVAVVVGEKMYFGKYGTVNIKDSSSSGGDSGDSGGGDDGGDDTTETWVQTLSAMRAADNGDYISRLFSLGYRIMCVPIIFKYGGTVRLFSTGNFDAYGYVNLSAEHWDSITGKPTNLEEFDESGGNFEISFEASANKTYYVWWRHKTATETGKITLNIECPEEQVGVEHWDWEIGTGSDRDKAYQAITSNGDVDDFSYSVWNELVDKVLEIIEADPNESVWFTESNNGTVYLSANSTKMTSSDKVMTAKRFNALRFNIGSRGSAPSTGIADKSTGETVYGEYFIILADCINGWINNL